MPTNYIKNFNREQFQKLYQKLSDANSAKEPLWRGTVYIGTQPLYIECHVKWLADKIDEYFFKSLPKEHVQNARVLYILNDGVEKFIQAPDIFTTNVIWCDGNIYRQPDLIVHNNCIFARGNNTCFISVDGDEKNNFYHLGENHLLMRLFGYIFNDNADIVLHGAVVGNDNSGVLITGLSGSGKSTLAAHCLHNGLKFVGDDRVALHKENGDVFANPIYTTLSLTEPINGLKIKRSFRPRSSTKDIIFLDKSQISDSVKITAIIEPIKTDSDKPIILKSPKAPVFTRICSDYSYLSLLTRSMNPLDDYKKISGLLDGIDTFSLHLSKSVTDNALVIINFLTPGGTNV